MPNKQNINGLANPPNNIENEVNDTKGGDLDFKDIKYEQSQKKQAYNISRNLTWAVSILWLIITICIISNIQCLIVSPTGWHILVYSMSLLLVAFSLSGRLFRRFYPNNSKENEEFNFQESITKSFDKLIDKLPEIFKK